MNLMGIVIAILVAVGWVAIDKDSYFGSGAGLFAFMLMAAGLAWSAYAKCKQR